MKAFFLFILFLPVAISVAGQSLNYPKIFGDDWKNADQFIISNREWMIPLFKKYDVNYNEAVAVIFPELVRYSALRDKMEITLLKALYINLGEDYANFSIGHFQMKPYFAEKIRETASELPSRKLRKLVTDSLKYEDMRIYRQAIVNDLEDIKSQTNYLILFMRLCRDKFRTARMDETSRIVFLATAYNTGFYKTEQEIREMTEKKFYSTRLVAKEHYSYSDISLFWYNQNNNIK